ncbi:MBL fold metallo-hydrolase [Paenibacillus sp. 7523-1]|uniref:MBL fold metallo-hydrolase n=1 Tax=Paenibacillus sp. 7523-1 TaxID=2022550 RepID=UPI000BA7C1DD|nr:MBL fold metallo-hydrolase [Paenibacillus sp. 7523-1]MBM6383246.1 MBL fold metallo-hydrolase [Paenibacillus sp.]PAD29628.1 MBL fold metallo-hydrolase [Paenibacillus sp. 7523-1]
MNHQTTDLTVLHLNIPTPSGNSPIYPVMLRDEDGITLVDTGMIGQFAGLEAALNKEGVQLVDVKRIILTHQDIDHIGNLGALLDAIPGLEVWAHADEIPYIKGEKPLIKFTPERRAMLPAPVLAQADQLLSQLPEIEISRVLEDGDMLPLQGGIQVIHTPGHTPGHICLYFRESEFLLAADELRVVDDELVGPAPPATPDMPEALRSLKRLTGLKLNKVLCYHGGEYTNEPSEYIAKLAESAD